MQRKMKMRLTSTNSMMKIGKRLRKVTMETKKSQKTGRGSWSKMGWILMATSLSWMP